MRTSELYPASFSFFFKGGLVYKENNFSFRAYSWSSFDENELKIEEVGLLPENTAEILEINAEKAELLLIAPEEAVKDVKIVKEGEEEKFEKGFAKIEIEGNERVEIVHRNEREQTVTVPAIALVFLPSKVVPFLTFMRVPFKRSWSLPLYNFAHPLAELYLKPFLKPYFSREEVEKHKLNEIPSPGKIFENLEVDGTEAYFCRGIFMPVYHVRERTEKPGIAYFYNHLAEKVEVFLLSRNLLTELFELPPETRVEKEVKFKPGDLLFFLSKSRLEWVWI